MAEKSIALAATAPAPAAGRCVVRARHLLTFFALGAVLSTGTAQAAGIAGIAGIAAGQVRETEKGAIQRRLLLSAKDPATWKIVAGGATGTLRYVEASGEFSFSAARLSPLTGYALVRYGALPAKADLLAEGTSDREGVLQLAGVWKQWTKKIWLVLSADVARSGTRVTAAGWHPERYLFEEKELGIPCDCEESP